MKIDTKWQKIPSAVSDEQVVLEYEALDRICSELYSRLGFGTAIEVGSFKGKSTAIIAQYFRVFAIDVWGTTENLGSTSEMKSYGDFGGDILKSFMKNMTERKLIYWEKEKDSIDRVYAICSTSKILERLPFLGISFAFIDAEHTYPAAYYDLTRCRDHLCRDGVIAIHDCMRPGWGYGDKNRSEVDPWFGNKLSLDRFLEENADFEIKEHTEGIVFIGRK